MSAEILYGRTQREYGQPWSSRSAAWWVTVGKPLSFSFLSRGAGAILPMLPGLLWRRNELNLQNPLWKEDFTSAMSFKGLHVSLSASIGKPATAICNKPKVVVTAVCQPCLPALSYAPGAPACLIHGVDVHLFI